MAELVTAGQRRAARQGGARRFLDADLHQLAPHTAVCTRLVAGVPRRRSGRDRRPHAGVLVRARPELVRRASEERGIDYPVAIDNDYAVWRAFDNHYWPALYFVDTDTVLRDQHFGEGRYEESERMIQGLLGLSRAPVVVDGTGVEAEADWQHLRSPETYLGYGRSERFASVGGATFDEPFHFAMPDDLEVNQWALDGNWVISREKVALERPGGSIVYRFDARDVHLVLEASGEPIPFRVLLDGQPPGPAHGIDVDENGNGVVRDGRLYQLIREPDDIRERTVEVTFDRSGVRGYVFTFG